jgi:hypothetical protein
MTFAACSDILLSEAGDPTLVGVFCALDAGHKQGAEIPENSINPRDWKIFTMWSVPESEFGRKFVQKTTVATPKGIEYGGAAEAFTSQLRSFTIKTAVHGMPIGVEGNVTVSVWLEHENEKVTPVHNLEISIRHRK